VIPVTDSPSAAAYLRCDDQRFIVEDTMPVYEYICQDCHYSFESVLTLKEHDTEKIRCPRCKSKKVEQDVAEFYAVTSRKS
jgi:putative FmdB family regulatory protein